MTVTTLSFATLTVTNFGPNDVILDSIVLGRSGGRWRRIKTNFPSPLGPAIAGHADGQRLRGNFASEAEVGDSSTIEFPINDTFFDGVEFIGVLDTFGRNHWCGPRHVERVREQLRGRRPR